MSYEEEGPTFRRAELRTSSPIAERLETSVCAVGGSLEAATALVWTTLHARRTRSSHVHFAVGDHPVDWEVRENHPVSRCLLELEQSLPAVPMRWRLAFSDPSSPRWEVTWEVERRGSDLASTLRYDADRVPREVAEAWLSQLALLLEGLAEDPHRLVRDLPWMTARERAEALALPPSFEPHPDVVEVLLARAAEEPEALAIETTEDRLSYAELVMRSGAVARGLAARGVSEGDVVAVRLPRSIDAFVAMLGIFRAGAVYLPLDVEWPAARVAFLKADAEPRLVVGMEGVPLAELEDSAAGPLPTLPDRPDASRYLLYTSGSSGVPKGALIPRRALTAHARGVVEVFALRRGDRVLQMTALGFDVHLEEVIPTWAVGGTVVVAEEASRASVQELVREVGAREVHVLNLPSRYFHELVLCLESATATLPPCVRLVVVGSERPSAELCRRAMAAHPHVTFVNAYGPTEATISVVAHRLERDVEEDDVPIGRPFPGSFARVVDAHARIVPDGTAGELVLGGPQLALGYHRRPEADARRFVRSPDDGALVYRTGDLVVRRGGVLRFLGRIDDQVKIRGVRVEPEEVAHVLREHPEVHDAAVLPWLRGDAPELVAYVVPPKGARASGLRRRLSAHLEERLPGPFVPKGLVLLEALPRTVGGKLDRAALPAPSFSEGAASASGSSELGEDGALPESPLEAVVVAAFEEVLSLPRVGRDQSFFELGGDSLLAMRLASVLTQVLGRPVELSALVAHPNPAGLAASIAAGGVVPRRPMLVPLNRDPGPGAPLYCLFGITHYTRLGRRMEGERPVYSCVLPWEVELFEGRSFAPVSIHEAARECAEFLREHAPIRPISLLGFSFGGALAHQVAHELACLGEEVTLVVNLDGTLPSAVRPKSLPSRLGLHARRLVDPRRALRHLGERVTRRWRRGSEGGADPRDAVLLDALERWERNPPHLSTRGLLVRATRSFSEWEQVDPWMGFRSHIRPTTPLVELEVDHLDLLEDAVTLEQVASLIRESLP